ncbi:YncE family protein [Winogradskyella sp.]|uniref:YncE family protein n=1 Tax=Winogradskyella sp. TaxID=1883156 RepID=UPI003BAC31F9
MKYIFRLFVFSISMGLILSSCSNDDDGTPQVPLGDYENGYFILHEGAGPITPVTYVGYDGTSEQAPFDNVNPGASPFGGFNQDLFFSGELAFIISGQFATVTVVNRYTLEFVASIDTDLENPRYGTVLDGKAYVTNSGDFSTTADDFVTIIDLSDYSTTTTVVGDIAERIEAINGKLYITNGSFGSGNSLTVIDPDNLNAPSTIDFGDGNSPNSLEAAGGSLYVLTSSFTTTGKVFTINLSNDSISNTLDLPATLDAPRQLDIEGNTIYFTNGTSVYGFTTGSSSVSDTPILTYQSSSQFGAMYGFSVKDNTIYIADAGDFVSNGTAFEYDLDGNLLNTITTDVAPNSFHFN